MSLFYQHRLILFGTTMTSDKTELAGMGRFWGISSIREMKLTKLTRTNHNKIPAKTRWLQFLNNYTGSRPLSEPSNQAWFSVNYLAAKWNTLGVLVSRYSLMHVGISRQHTQTFAWLHTLQGPVQMYIQSRPGQARPGARAK